MNVTEGLYFRKMRHGYFFQELLRNAVPLCDNYHYEILYLQV